MDAQPNEWPPRPRLIGVFPCKEQASVWIDSDGAPRVLQVDGKTYKVAHSPRMGFHVLRGLWEVLLFGDMQDDRIEAPSEGMAERQRRFGGRAELVPPEERAEMQRLLGDRAELFQDAE